ncbi:MAG: type II toxin-antitoxin system RelE/ParE family toxin [Gammaproteobacteria bacterium]|nr:type II toxin-antitoxin system RelE/ParE family toxin [Gammaproteobacteria bacterium]MDJ0890844.1 type II toxin-antitoxin system RelE/ParE family toxin [Gammaproteobacteria bacterium]
MIRSFKCKDTEKLFNDLRVRRFQAFEIVARRKLNMLDNATSLNDLAVLPGNRLEALRGKRSGQHSIRINDQYRVCFEWRSGDVHNVQIVDYH